MNNKKNKFGLSDKDLNYIIPQLTKIPEIQKAVIFGSRAMGNYKKGSDIDIAVFGKNITFDILSRIYNILNEEIPIPYFVDVVHFESTKNEEFKKHILEEGKVIFEI